MEESRCCVEALIFIRWCEQWVGLTIHSSKHFYLPPPPPPVPVEYTTSFPDLSAGVPFKLQPSCLSHNQWLQRATVQQYFNYLALYRRCLLVLYEDITVTFLWVWLSSTGKTEVVGWGHFGTNEGPIYYAGWGRKLLSPWITECQKHSLVCWILVPMLLFSLCISVILKPVD